MQSYIIIDIININKNILCYFVNGLDYEIFYILTIYKKYLEFLIPYKLDTIDD